MKEEKQRSKDYRVKKAKDGLKKVQSYVPQEYHQRIVEMVDSGEAQSIDSYVREALCFYVDFDKGA